MFRYASFAIHLLSYRVSRMFNHPILPPVSLSLSVTGKCFSRCKTCNIWKNTPEDELTTEEWANILKRIGKSPVWFTLTGGETMLRSDLPEIVSFINRYNKPGFINIATSGIYPEKTKRIIGKILETLPKDVMLTVNISVDEVEGSYKKVRGVDSYKNVVKTFSILHGFGERYPNLVIGANTVISKYNFKRFRHIREKIMKDLRPDSFVSEIGAKRKELGFEEDISIPKKDYLELLDHLIESENQDKKARITRIFRKRYYSLVKRHILEKKKIVNCYVGYASCEISSTGEVWDCCVYARSMGNLRKNSYDLMDILRSRKAKKLRDKISEGCYCNTANQNYTNMLCNLKI